MNNKKQYIINFFDKRTHKQCVTCTASNLEWSEDRKNFTLYHNPNLETIEYFNLTTAKRVARVYNRVTRGFGFEAIVTKKITPSHCLSKKQQGA